MAADERELGKLRAENERLKDDRRKDDILWREDTTERIGNLERGVSDLNQKVSGFLQRQEERDRDLSKRCEEHHAVLFGTKESPTSGMFLRLDRLEGSAKNISKLWWLIVGALVSGAGAAIWAVTHFGPS